MIFMADMLSEFYKYGKNLKPENPEGGDHARS